MTVVRPLAAPAFAMCVAACPVAVESGLVPARPGTAPCKAGGALDPARPMTGPGHAAGDSRRRVEKNRRIGPAPGRVALGAGCGYGGGLAPNRTRSAAKAGRRRGGQRRNKADTGFRLCRPAKVAVTKAKPGAVMGRHGAGLFRGDRRKWAVAFPVSKPARVFMVDERTVGRLAKQSFSVLRLMDGRRPDRCRNVLHKELERGAGVADGVAAMMVDMGVVQAARMWQGLDDV